jgi:DNA-binding XRE family transcriptional regulator
MQSRSTQHRSESHREYLSGIWRGIKARCENPTHKSYHNYGGRGIKLSGGWEDKEQFLLDMWDSGLEYNSGLSVEREDVNGDYCPTNCVTATAKEQARNTRNTLYIQYDGNRVKVCDLADDLGINASTLRKRVHSYNPKIHGTDWKSYLESDKVKILTIENKRGNTVTVDGVWFPSESEAALHFGKDRSTIRGRAERFGISFAKALMMSEEEVQQRNLPNSNSSEIIYKGTTYPTHRALAKVLGIDAGTITMRNRKYDPDKHGSWDTYISAPLQVVSGKPVLFGQTFESNAAAARHFNIPTNTLCNWLYNKSIEEVETEIKNYGTAKKGVRSKIIYKGVEHTQSSLAKLTGINQTTIGRWHKTLTPEQLSCKIEEYQRGERYWKTNTFSTK